MLNNTYVFTEKGLILRDNLDSNSMAYDCLGNLTKITYENTFYTSADFFYEFKNSIEDINYILRADEKILAVINGLYPEYVSAEFLQKGDWVFHPWIANKSETPFRNIDLSKFSDNLKNTTTIYVLNHEILKIADHFNIQPSDLKEILTREAAEYEDIIEDVKAYITTHYCRYEDFFKYIEKNFTFKMPRYIEVYTKEFITFLACTLMYNTSSLFFLLDNKEHNVVYSLVYKIPKKYYLKYFKLLENFCTHYNVKHYLKEEENFIIFTIKNKPLYQLVNKLFKYSLNNLKNCDKDLRILFIELMSQSDKIYGSVRLLLELKEFFYFNKIVSSLCYDETDVPYLKILSDDFHKLDSTLIIENNGYYTQIIEKSSVDTTRKYKYLNMDTKSLLTTSYAKYER